MPVDESREQEVDAPDEVGELVREEAREVLTAQLQALRETDNKALSTARMNALILGVLLSGASLADDPTGLLNNWFFVGGGLLLLSLVAAILSYSVDRPSYGIGPGYIDGPLNELDDRSDVEADLLARYADWIDANTSEIWVDNVYLAIAQFFLLAGLASVGYAVLQAL